MKVRVCAVYAITCSDGRGYVGGSVDIRSRWNEHRSLLRRGKHRNRILQSAWTDLGEEAFAFSILETTSPEKLLVAEQGWIDRLGTTSRIFNLSPTAGSCAGIVYGAETRAKIASSLRGKTRSEEHKAKLSAAHKGKVLSKEHRAKISAASLGRPKTAAHRAKISEGLRRASERSQ